MISLMKYFANWIQNQQIHFTHFFFFFFFFFLSIFSSFSFKKLFSLLRMWAHVWWEKFCFLKVPFLSSLEIVCCLRESRKETSRLSLINWFMMWTNFTLSDLDFGFPSSLPSFEVFTALIENHQLFFFLKWLTFHRWVIQSPISISIIGWKCIKVNVMTCRGLRVERKQKRNQHHNSKWKSIDKFQNVSMHPH